MTAATAPASAAAISASRRMTFRRLWHYMRRRKRVYAAGTLTTLVYAGLFVLFPLTAGWCIQALVDGRPRGEIALRCGVLVAIALARSAVRFFSRVQLFDAAREIEYELRNDLFSQLLRLPQSFYGRWRTGDIMSRCVNDTNAVRLLMGVAVLNILQTPVLYLAVVGTMLSLNPRLALFVLLPYPLFILFARAIGWASR